jgi:hypothetical protein
MVTVHAFLALLAGFATMAISVVIVTALLARVAPDWVQSEGRPRPANALVNLGYSFLAAAGGGFITAWASAANPLIHVLVLGIVVLAMAALSALQAKGKQPVWYALCLVVLMPFGVLAGGLLRLRILGIL